MTRSTLFSRNRLTLVLIKNRRSTDATGDLLSKNFAIFTRKHMCWSRPATLLKRHSNTCFPVNIGKILKNLFWRTSAYACFWRDFGKWLIRTFFLEKPEPFLNLTPKLYFELSFLYSSLTVTREKQTLVVPGLLVFHIWA